MKDVQSPCARIIVDEYAYSVVTRGKKSSVFVQSRFEEGELEVGGIAIYQLEGRSIVLSAISGSGASINSLQ